MIGTHEHYATAKRMLEGKRRILVSGHLSPDGDALGSMIALVRLLKGAGFEAFATADVNALGKPGFLEGVDEITPVRKLKRQKKFAEKIPAGSGVWLQAEDGSWSQK